MSSAASSPVAAASTVPAAAAAAAPTRSPRSAAAVDDPDDDDQHSFHSFASPCKPAHTHAHADTHSQHEATAVSPLPISAPLDCDDGGHTHSTPRRRSSAAHTPTRRLSLDCSAMDDASATAHADAATSSPAAAAAADLPGLVPLSSPSLSASPSPLVSPVHSPRSIAGPERIIGGQRSRQADHAGSIVSPSSMQLAERHAAAAAQSTAPVPLPSAAPHVRSPFLLGCTPFAATAAPSAPAASLSPRPWLSPQHPQLVPSDRELSAAHRRQPHPLVLGTTAYREHEEAQPSSCSSSGRLGIRALGLSADPFESLVLESDAAPPLPSHLFAAPSAIVVSPHSTAPSAFQAELQELRRQWTDSDAKVTVLEAHMQAVKEQLADKEQLLATETRAHAASRTQAQENAFRDRALIESLQSAAESAAERNTALEASLASQLRAREATLVAHLDEVVHSSLARDRERTECIAVLESQLQETRAAVAAMEKAAVLAAEEAAATQSDASAAVAEALGRCDQLSLQLSAALSTAEEQSLAITALQSSLNASHDALVHAQRDCDRTLAAERGSHQADLAALASSHMETTHSLKHDASLASRRVASLELQLGQSASQLALVESSMRKLTASSARSAEDLQARCHASESELAAVRMERDRLDFEAKAATQALMDTRTSLAQLQAQLEANRLDLEGERQSWASRVADLSRREQQLDDALTIARNSSETQGTHDRITMEAAHAARVASLESALSSLRESHAAALSAARDAAAAQTRSSAQERHEHALAMAEANRAATRQIDSLKAQLAKAQTDMASHLSSALTTAAREGQEAHESAMRLVREQHAASLAATIKQAAADRAELSSRLAAIQSQCDEKIAVLTQELQSRSASLSATTLALHSAQLSAQRAEAELQRVLDASASASSELEVSRVAWESLRARLLSESAAASAQSAEEIRSLKAELDSASRQHAARITELESVRLSSESRWQIEMALAQRAQSEAEAHRAQLQRELQEAHSAITSVRDTIAAGDAQRAKQHRTAMDALTQQLASTREELLSLRSTSESDRAAQQSCHAHAMAALSQQLCDSESRASDLQDQSDALDLMLSIQGAKLAELEASLEATVDSRLRAERNEAQQAIERLSQQHARALHALREQLSADHVAALDAQTKSFAVKESAWSTRLFSLEHELTAAQMQCSTIRSSLEDQQRESSERESLLLALLPRDLGLLSTKELRQRKRVDSVAATSPVPGKLATLHEDASAEANADALDPADLNQGAEGSSALPLELGEVSLTAEDAAAALDEGSSAVPLAGTITGEGLENSAPLRLAMLDSLHGDPHGLSLFVPRVDDSATALLLSGYTEEIASLCASNAHLRELHQHTLSILGIEEQKRRDMQAQLDQANAQRTTLQHEERKLADLQLQLLAASTGGSASNPDASAESSIPPSASLSDFSPHSPPSLLYAALVSLHASASDHDAVLTAHIAEIAAQFEALKVSRDRWKTKCKTSKEEHKRNKQQWKSKMQTAAEELEALRRQTAAQLAELHSQSAATLAQSSARVAALQSSLASLSSEHSAEVNRLRSDFAAAQHAADLKHASLMLRQRNMHDAVIAQIRRTHKEEITKLSATMEDRSAASLAMLSPARAVDIAPSTGSVPVTSAHFPAAVAGVAVAAPSAASAVIAQGLEHADAPRSAASVVVTSAPVAPVVAAAASSPSSSFLVNPAEPIPSSSAVSPAVITSLPTQHAGSTVGPQRADLVVATSTDASSTPPLSAPLPLAVSPPIAKNSILFALLSASASTTTSPVHARAANNLSSLPLQADHDPAAAGASPVVSTSFPEQTTLVGAALIEPPIAPLLPVAGVIAPIADPAAAPWSAAPAGCLVADVPAPPTRRQLSVRRLAEDEAATARLFDTGVQLTGITSQQLPLPLPPLPPTPRVEAPSLPSLPSTAQQSPLLRTRCPDQTDRSADPEDVLMLPFQ